MNEIMKQFEFEGKGLRTLDKEGEFWWIAQDVCEILGIKNVTQAVERLHEDERSMFNIGRQGEANIINEPGLYRLIFSSKKKNAEIFKRWVYHEILPSIRKTGKYDKNVQHEAIEAGIELRLPAIQTQLELRFTPGGRRRKILLDRLKVQKDAEIIMNIISKHKKITHEALVVALFAMTESDRKEAIYYLLDKEKIDHKRIGEDDYLFFFEDMETRNILKQIMIGETIKDDLDMEDSNV